jgi:hypothetical protein
MSILQARLEAGRVEAPLPHSAQRFNGELVSPTVGTLTLNHDSPTFIRWNGIVKLPPAADLTFPVSSVPNVLVSKIEAYRLIVLFSAPGQVIQYSDGTVAFTSTAANQLVEAFFCDVPPFPIGTWQFGFIMTSQQVATMFTWKDTVQTCGPIAPPAPVVGQRWLNLTLQVIQMWNGAMWVTIAAPLPGDAVHCVTMPGGIYFFDGLIWDFWEFEMTTPGLGLKFGIPPGEILVDNGRGITFNGNKVEAALGAGLNFLGAAPGAPIEVQVDNTSIEIVGNQLKKKSYRQTFLIPSWIFNGVKWEQTFTGLAHGQGKNCDATVYKGLAVNGVDETLVDPISGDVTIRVLALPDLRFAGNIVIQ